MTRGSSSCVLRTLSLFALLGSSLEAQVHRFDMGPANTPVAPGFVAVEPATTYSAIQGYGWVTPPPLAVQRAGVSTQFALEEQNFPAALVEDSVTSVGTPPPGYTFQVDVPSGTYWCFAYLGDLGDPGAQILTPLEGMDIVVNGTKVVDDAFARLLADKATFYQARGGYKRVAFLADTGASSFLFLRFKSTGDDPVSLMGLEVYPYIAPPVSFDRAQQQLVVDPAFQQITELVAGVSSMNVHDYQTARTHFDAVTNRIARAWAHAWWLGWLTDEEAAVDEALLDQTRSLLETLETTLPDDPRVKGLLYELRDFQWGELFNRTRGYSNFPNPKATTASLVTNLCAGVQFLEQMDADLLDAAPDGTQSQSPFFAKAQYQIAKNMYGRNTHLVQEVKKGPGFIVSAEEYGTYMLAIFDALWPRLDPNSAPVDRIFPKAYEALMLGYRIHQGHPPAGQWYPLADWDGSVPNIALAELQQTWWYRDGYTDIPNEPGHAPPAWADYQRRYDQMLKNATRWWIERREIDGELGGGTGDDVEAAALVLPRLAVSEGANEITEAGFKRVLNGVIEANDFDEPQGYVNYVTDSAHGGENASFPLLFFTALRYGDARYLEQAMHNVRNLDETSSFPGEGVAWSDTPSWLAGLTPRRRIFKAFWFSSTALTGNSSRHDDVAINYRAILGGFPLMDFNGSPRTVQLYEEHAWAWRDAAMDTAAGYARPKPMGVFPVSIEYATGLYGEPGASGQEWWSHSQPNAGGIGSNGSVIYGALLDAYERSTAPNRKDLIEPLHQAVAFVHANPPDANALPPSNGWVSSKIHVAVTSVAYRAREALQLEWGTSAQMIDDLIQLYGSEYVKYLELPPAGGKPKNDVEDVWRDAVTWLEYFFPLATQTVSYTDRIKLVPEYAGGLRSLHSLDAMRSGAPGFDVVPTRIVIWSNPNSGVNDLDVALLVNDVTPSTPVGGGKMKILAFNANPSSQTVRMKLWRVLTPGNYTITMGNDTNFDDAIDGFGMLVFKSFDYKGDFIDITLPPGVLRVIDIQQTSVASGTPPLLDLGLSEDRFSLRSGRYEATVSNLGTQNYGGTTAALELRNASGGLLENVAIPAILAPGIPGQTDLTGQTWTYVFAHTPIPGETLTVRIVNTAAEITAENDAVTKTF